MKLKKILAATAATAMVVTSVIAASAEEDSVLTEVKVAEKTEITAWSDWVTLDVSAQMLDSEESIVIVMEPIVGGEKECYIKLAGNDMNGEWSSTSFEGAPASIEGITYDAAEGTVTVPADAWWNYSQIFIQGEYVTYYGVAWESDTETIEAAKALRAADVGSADAPVKDEPVVDKPVADEPTGDTTTEDTTSNTGLVGLSLAGLAAAGAAVVATKKRK